MFHPPLYGGISDSARAKARDKKNTTPASRHQLPASKKSPHLRKVIFKRRHATICQPGKT